MKKLEAEIDSIRFEPRSAMEFRDAKKEEQRMAQRQQSAAEKKREAEELEVLKSASEQQFRLKQKPEHQSHVLRGRIDAEKAAEREKLRQLQQQFAKADEENPFKKLSQPSQAGAPKPTPAQQYLSDLATNDLVSQQDNYQSAFKDLAESE